MLVLLFGALLLQTGNRLAEEARLHPDSATANHLAGEYYLKENDLKAAIPYLEAAHRLDPTNYVNSFDLATAYLQAGSANQSRSLVNELLQHGDKGELHNLLGDIEEASGQVDQAAHEYELAARLDPSEKNLFDLGSDLLKHRGFQPALTVFDFSVKKYPQSSRLRVGLGVSHYSLGQYDDAVQALCQAVDLDPKDTKALDFLGKMYDISPVYADEVTKRLAGFVHTYPHNAAASYYYALSLHKRALNRQAELYLLHALELQPTFADAHYELGLLYQDQHESAKAITQLEIAVKQRPDFLQAHYHLAQLYKKAQKYHLADAEFARIEELKARSSH